MAKWNDKQQKVIDSRKLNGQILISAAAGSGKTAVLVERILRSVLDKTDGEYVNNIDDFLVVTFTRAAAAQMKDKISNKITELLNEEAGKEFPDKELVDHLLKQQVSVGRADICTLDSFSAKVVRENFNVIGIDPSFVTADANLMKLLKDDILSEMFDELFSGKDGRYVSSADFCELASFFFRKTDDTDLKNACLKIMRVAETMPEPEKWLRESKINDSEDREKALNSLRWMDRLLEDIKGQIKSAIDINDRVQEIAEELAENTEGMTDKEIANVGKMVAKAEEDREKLDILYQAADKENGGSYRLIREALSGCSFARKGTGEPEAYSNLRGKYSLKSGLIGSIPENLVKGGKLPDTEELIAEVYDNAARWINIFVDVCLEFSERVMAEKNRRKQYEFSDISHFALKVLSECEDGRIKRDEAGNAIPSRTARALSNKYKYIYVDEYQDSSYIQEDMINTIARIRNGVPVNIFMVGDVKQSIYRFRQAKPELFVNKYNTFENITDASIEELEKRSGGAAAGAVVGSAEGAAGDVNGAAAGSAASADDAAADGGSGRSKGMVIDLSKNYRSRRPVLDATNFIFSSLMRRDIGGLDYDDRVKLNFGAGEAGIYDEGSGEGRKTELIIITKPEEVPEEDAEDAGSADAKTADKPDADSSTKKAGENKALADDDSEFGNDEYEAAVVADRIEELLNDESFTVNDEEKGTRRLRASDIVILMRSLKGRTDAYEDALTRRGIGVKVDNESGYFDAIETVTMLSMLRVIDNIRQDIPLAAVLDSPIGGLDDSDMMLIAGEEYEGRKASFYDKCTAFRDRYLTADKSDETKTAVAARMDRFFKLREEMVSRLGYISISMLIREILDKTGYDIYASMLPMGERRLANLSMLMKKAEDFEAGSYSGLFNFLRYIDKCRIHDIDFGEADVSSDGSDKVTIMTIHKSKGLEFPVVFLAGLGHQFNKMDEKDNIFVDGDDHLAVNYIDPKRRIKDKSFMSRVMLRLSTLGKAEEEQRLLYVGMTRAKEYLIMSGVDKGYFKKCEKGFDSLDYKIRSTLKDYLTWIEPVVMTGTKDVIIKKVMTFDDIDNIGKVRRLNGKMDYDSLTMKLERLSAEEDVRKKADEQYEIYELSKHYKYKDDVTAFAKMSVSDIKKQLMEAQFEDTERYAGKELYDPADKKGLYDFMLDCGDADVEFSAAGAVRLDDPAAVAAKSDDPAAEEVKDTETYDAAGRGTLIHRVYELIDFKRIDSAEDMKKEIERVLTLDCFSEDDRAGFYEKNDIELMIRFADTELFGRMKEADRRGKLYKEAEFTMGVPSKELGIGQEGSGTVIIQGIIDGYFIDEDGEAVIMDYKSDKTANKLILIKRYKPQLELYAKALTGIRGLKVKEKIIYSLVAGEVKL